MGQTDDDDWATARVLDRREVLSASAKPPAGSSEFDADEKVHAWLSFYGARQYGSDGGNRRRGLVDKQ